MIDPMLVEITQAIQDSMLRKQQLSQQIAMPDMI